MKRPRKSDVTRYLGVAIVLVAVLAFVVWEVTRPKINLASRAEIARVLPPDTVANRPIDVAALVRMTRLVELSRIIHDNNYNDLTKTSLPIRQRAVSARSLWRGRRGTFDEVTKILGAGPIEAPPLSDSRMNLRAVAPIRNMGIATAMIGECSAETGDFETACRSFDICFDLCSRMVASRGGYAQYTVTAGIFNGLDRAISDAASRSKLPSDLCRHLLDRLSPETNGDPLLVSALQTEFDGYARPRLADPTLFMRDLMRFGIGRSGFPSPVEPPIEDYLGVGTFDPIPTAQTMEEVLRLQTHNALEPFSRYDATPDDIARREASDLPQDRGRRQSFERIRFRLAMNVTRNSIGREMIARQDSLGGKPTIALSCHWRAFHEATRVLLASILFRRDHGGSLPKRLDDLMPKYLQSLPIDPFNGLPMRYSASLGKVWSVSKNLIDDHGQIENRGATPRDLGLPL